MSSLTVMLLISIIFVRLIEAEKRQMKIYFFVFSNPFPCSEVFENAQILQPKYDVI